jgi:hypothetical protein
MSRQNNGGTAFPMQDSQAIHSYAAAQIEGITDNEERDRLYTQARAEAVGGMSLRDAMAIAAAGHIWVEFQRDGTAKQYPEWRQGVAVEAYRLADEMLAAREQS